MSPFSWPVVLGTLVLASPALWASEVSGTLSPDIALMRLLVCLVGVWAACSAVVVLSERTVAANDLATAADDSVSAQETALMAAAAAEPAAAGDQAAASADVGLDLLEPDTDAA